MRHISFSGPLFVVGMPRSGTKLLRDLLNGHSKIAIPVAESHFIPYFHRIYGNHPEFGKNNSFDDFYIQFCGSPFFINMKRRNVVMDKEQFALISPETTSAEVFEDILKYYARKEKTTDRIIWGDKTPGYVRYMGLLKNLYPDARFLHIIRDPRDYCLSVSNAWGKSQLRAADRWLRTMQKTRKEGEAIGRDYKEVFYESLLDQPEKVLGDISTYVELEFEPTMLVLRESTENLGDARGKLEIVRSNQQKFLTAMSSKRIQRIEEIVYPVKDSSPYEFRQATEFKPLSKISQGVYKIYDGFASIRFHIRDKGFADGAHYFLSLHQKSSWR